MKTKKLQKLILDNEFKVEYHNNDSYLEPLPNKITLYVDNDCYKIDISLTDVLETEIWIKESKVHLTDLQLDWIYNKFTEWLNYQIDSVKNEFLEIPDHNYYYIQ